MAVLGGDSINSTSRKSVGHEAGMTPAGRATSLVAVMFGGAGLLVHYPAFIVMATGAAIVLLAAAVALARTAVTSVVIEAEPTQVSRGESLVLTARIANNTERRCPESWIRLPSLFDAVAFAVPAISPGSATEIAVEVRATRRGVWRLCSVPATQSGRLGLLERPLTVEHGAVLRVWPRVVAGTSLRGTGPSREEHPAGVDVFDGGGAFDTLREYSWGDDTRRIHWPSLFRTGTVLLRTYSDPGSQAVTVILDLGQAAYQSAGSESSAFEAAVDTAASVVVNCLERGYAVRLYCGGAVQTQRLGAAAGRAAVLDALADVTLLDAGDGDGTPLVADAQTALAHGVHAPEGILVIVTGDQDTGQLDVARQMRPRFGRTVLVRARGARWQGRGTKVLDGVVLIEGDIPQLPGAWSNFSVAMERRQ
jgi:uncharacterized protein (DUF58 family)